MKALKLFTMAVLVLFLTANCNKSNIEKDYSVLLDTVSKLKYYQDDPLNEKYQDFYGIWKVIGTSGGFSGQGYKPDFEYLLVKANLIFGIVRNDSLITTGKIKIKNQDENELCVDFISDIEPDKVNIIILNGLESYIEISGDSLNLVAPCCDFFNTHLKKIK
jgi:hypothetical protein